MGWNTAFYLQKKAAFFTESFGEKFGNENVQF